MKTTETTETLQTTTELVERLLKEMDKAFPSLFLQEAYDMDKTELGRLESLREIRGTWDEEEFPRDILIQAHADDLHEKIAKTKESLREQKVHVLRASEIMARQAGHHGLGYKLREAWLELCQSCGGADQQIAELAPKWEGYLLTFAREVYELLPTRTGCKLLGRGGALAEAFDLDEAGAKYWAETYLLEIQHAEKKCPTCGCTNEQPCTRHEEGEDDAEVCYWMPDGLCSFCSEGKH